MLPLLRRIVLVLLREFTGYNPQQAGGQAGFQQPVPPGSPMQGEAGQQALQQLLQQNDALAKALQRAQVRQRITLWISLAALLLSSMLWFSR